MPAKTAPLGICDQCGDPIPQDRWYTSKRTPRLHCSLACKQTANSRAGNDIRIEKMRERIAKGDWINPSAITPPTPAEQARRARLGRRREVAAGEWRNPALTDDAKAKLSQPRKHTGDLASAIDKIGQGYRIDELTSAEQEAHRTYRADLRNRRKDEINAQARERYRRQRAAMTDAERDAQAAKWRRARQARQARTKKDGPASG